MANRTSKLLVGTSGWSYRSWRGPFFPKDVPERGHLEYYARQFPTTELNGVFYRTPTEEAVRGWAERTPADFVFAWKASKFITHWKRLNDTSRNSLELMESRLRLLGGKAGPVLFQLPPQFEKNLERLAAFLKLLGPRRPYVFEFRHPSWYEDDALDLLRDNDIALCISDHHDAPSPWLVTARHVYVRGHGPQGRYRGHYSRNTLDMWARRLRKLCADGRDAYVYFDNDQKSAAPKDALLLMQMLENRAKRNGRGTIRRPEALAAETRART
jgi:uncharacterized protein YecE (DUF72 family)